MKTYVHPLDTDRVPVPKATIAEVIKQIDDKHLIFQLEEILIEDDIIEDNYERAQEI